MSFEIPARSGSECNGREVESSSATVYTNELLPQNSRIVVYGTRSSGSFDLVGELNKLTPEDTDIYASRDIANIENAFFGRGRISAREQEVDQSTDTVPTGVIMFPEMRRYHRAVGLDVPTPTQEIMDLCNQHNVPFIFAERIQSDSDLQLAIGQTAIALPNICD
jgi:hypothetical protein